MEIGHNVLHGQWDWMNDPVINSSSWDWDNVSPADGWKFSHNYVHHTYTNIRGMDRDLGYEIMRIDPHQKWHPVFLAQPIYNLILMGFFEWGVALHDLDLGAIRKREKPIRDIKMTVKEIGKKVAGQVIKDYVAFPALSGPKHFKRAVAANFTANIIRNVWSYSIIFCGHFPDQTYTFSFDSVDLEDEDKGHWYVRQLLGAANIDGGPFFHVMSGNLGYQVEHHLFPDMPSTRYGEIAPRVREICEQFELPYNSGPLHRQLGRRAPHDHPARLPGRQAAQEARPVQGPEEARLRRAHRARRGGLIARVSSGRCLSLCHASILGASVARRVWRHERACSADRGVRGRRVLDGGRQPPAGRLRPRP